MNRRGGWRHAPHDGGNGRDGAEEYSFSDSRHHHPRQGEAAIRHHGFLYLFHHHHRRNTQWGEHVIAPTQAAATQDRRSRARRSASRKGNGVAFPLPQFGDQDTTISNYPMINNEKFMEVRTICVKMYAL